MLYVRTLNCLKAAVFSTTINEQTNKKVICIIECSLWREKYIKYTNLRNKNKRFSRKKEVKLTWQQQVSAHTGLNWICDTYKRIEVMTVCYRNINNIVNILCLLLFPRNSTYWKIMKRHTVIFSSYFTFAGEWYWSGHSDSHVITSVDFRVFVHWQHLVYVYILFLGLCASVVHIWFVGPNTLSVWTLEELRVLCVEYWWVGIKTYSHKICQYNMSNLSLLLFVRRLNRFGMEWYLINFSFLSLLLFWREISTLNSFSDCMHNLRWIAYSPIHWVLSVLFCFDFVFVCASKTSFISLSK